jgi:murein DD-endopeptidase MepM/ murein hydrolase activator NlpD
MSLCLSARARPGGFGLSRTEIVRVLVLTLVSTTSAGVGPAEAEPAAAPGDPQPVLYTPPVSAEVMDPFRAPSHPYGPGNRGLKYDTEPAQEVRASADGEVVFAGPVAGSLHVTVLHADGVRTSYSFLPRWTSS